MRWVLTRRAAIALAIVAIAVLGTLRYNAYMVQTQEEERKRMKKQAGGDASS
ncbi:MAG: hypothetical protein INR71_08940, partial [Terriglobus roseus]|nr:hypothetical protein [Terriglobus roseus]